MKHSYTKMVFAAALPLVLVIAALLFAGSPTTADYAPPPDADVSTSPQLINHTSVLSEDVDIVMETEPDAAAALTRLEAGELDIYAPPRRWRRPGRAN